MTGEDAGRWLFARALFAFLALPGMVAFLIPWRLAPRAAHRPLDLLGAVPFAVGAVLLLWCVRDFYVVGKGTLAPWSPPRRLVVVGLYRFTRNPMYVAVMLILTGWALLHHSRTLWIYALCVFVLFHLRVVFGEEPFLARTHGADWEAYRAKVPRWLI
ncbi:MAG TPA: isoprenylcysteine carboxylmethyltransferase family protein [Gemmatimonadaceae bacterium]|nr:isoprenylcysteine carboxylmethyltransferase family protein [Gemmatimonadaceae bacterium]